MSVDFPASSLDGSLASLVHSQISPIPQLFPYTQTTTISSLIVDAVKEAIDANATEDPNRCGLQPHAYLEVKFFLISVVGSIIGLFGLFGNISTALILTRPSMRNPNNLYLTALAVFDSCLLITAFFIYAMEYIIEYTQQFQLYVAWLTYLRFAFALSHISQTGSVYVTVTVTIERYLAVCYPKRSKRYCSSGGAAWTILGVTTFALLFNSTKFFELEVTINPECGEGTNWQSYMLKPSKMAQNEYYQQVYALWITNFVMVFFPFCCLLVLNSIIAYTIKRSLQKFDYSDPKIQVKDRHELKEKSREATMVLITIVFIFLICNFWGFVLTLLEQILPSSILHEDYGTFYTFSREAINFLAIINSSINFVIYIIFGKDFRKELIIVYGCGMRGMTLRLPTHDKFSIWRTWTKRVDIRRSISMVTARRKSHAVGSEDPHSGRRTSMLLGYRSEFGLANGQAVGTPGASSTRGGGSSSPFHPSSYSPAHSERLIPLIDDHPRLNGHLHQDSLDSPIKCLVNGSEGYVSSPNSPRFLSPTTCLSLQKETIVSLSSRNGDCNSDRLGTLC
ncbi:unnamed protein product, partial [Mesorhabditis belari]|uniref:G-protein coupled receptors family 1 profile domain-containing protein n=1 Tax=Mesorhabditis belari TaxID=2138241 RepID=A0AAF3F011_9BILA